MDLAPPLRDDMRAGAAPERRQAWATIAEYAVDLVTALGSDTVFSLTGGMAMHLNRAVSTQPGLRAVYCQHEQAAVAAAEGYASAADFRRAGFAVVTSGPGVANTVTSLLSANINSIPLAILAGQVKSEDIDRVGLRTHGVQEVPSEAFLTPCVKRFVRLDRTHFREQLVGALAEMISGRPGPVVIEIPLDVQGSAPGVGPEALDEDLVRIYARAEAGVGTEAARARFDELFAELAQAKRPLIYIGNGCRLAGIEGFVRDFVERTGTPAVFSWPSFDILPADHPMNFGCPGGLAPIAANRVLGEADRILFLGARLDLATTGFQREAFGQQAERTFVDVDAAELLKFAGQPKVDVACLDLRALKDHAVPQGKTDPAWAAWCQEQKREGLAEERRRLATDGLNLYALAQRISAWSQGRVIAPASSGYATETFIRFFEPKADCRIFTSAGLGAMGFGLPMGLGAALGSERPVACVDADGGLMLNIQELSTLKRLAPKGFVLFVMNNDGYESIRMSQQRHFGDKYGTDEESGVSIPSFEALSAAFGLPYVRIETLEALDAFIAGHDDNGPPVVVDVIVPRSEPRGPSVKTIVHPDGRLASTPLKDIAW
jgi:acetolactate synthase-1/2/3 large subunit